MMDGFREWLMVEFDRGRVKLGLYAPMDNALGQYPPLYVAPRAADFITYYDIEYKGKGAPGKNGFIWYSDAYPGEGAVRTKRPLESSLKSRKKS